MKKILCGMLVTLALACGAHGPAFAADNAMPPTIAFASCSWDHPGVNPFMGDVVAAVDRYRDIAPDVRERLKARMVKREYDDLVSIRRDSIVGRGGYDYGSTIREMHFGTHQLCHAVTRASWSPAMEELGLVYCESGQCILVPTVCRNVSRITRSGVADQAAEGPSVLAAPPIAEAPVSDVPVAEGLPPIDWFGPAGAGAPPGIGAPAEGSFGEVASAGPGTPVGFANGTYAFLPAVIGGVAGGVTGASRGGGPDLSARSTSPFAPNGGGVTTAAVPEPQTWAMVLFGLALLMSSARILRGRRPH
jgi:hypothetical protein